MRVTMARRSFADRLAMNSRFAMIVEMRRPIHATSEMTPYSAIGTGGNLSSKPRSSTWKGAEVSIRDQTRIGALMPARCAKY